jgi:large subunit ribosomal protein L25
MSIKPKALRRENAIPGVIYGNRFDARQVQFGRVEFERLLRQGGMNVVLDVTIAGDAETHSALIREVQRNPVNGQILHVDLLRILANETLRTHVPVVLEGHAPVTASGATISHLLEAIEIECLPRNLPPALHVSLAKLVDADSRLTVADLIVPEGVTVLSDPEANLVAVNMPRLSDEVEGEETEVEETEVEEVESEEAE